MTVLKLIGLSRVNGMTVKAQTLRGTMKNHSRPTGSMRRAALVLMTMLPLLSAQTAPGNASPVDELKRMARQLDRTMCRTLVGGKCRAHATSRTPTAKKARKNGTAKQSPGTVATAPDSIVKPQIVKPPNLKPDVVAAMSPASKVVPILPTLKPKTLVKTAAQTKKPLEVPVPVSSAAPDARTARPSKAPEAIIAMLPRAIIPVLPPVAPAPHDMPDDVVVGEACMTALKKSGANFVQPATPVFAGACSVTDAVRLKSLRVGENLVAFPDQPTFTCGFALRFANWIDDQADPIVHAWTKMHIKSIGTGPGYECRGRNGDSSAKLSEHAFGNAADIERIKLGDGQTIEIKDAIDGASRYQTVLAGLRAAGCQYFMTVLGPGANAAHASHFHFDLQRRGKKGNHKMCE